MREVAATVDVNGNARSTILVYGTRGGIIAAAHVTDGNHRRHVADLLAIIAPDADAVALPQLPRMSPDRNWRESLALAERNDPRARTA